MNDKPPYDSIIQKGDRSWTLRLLERLKDSGIDAEEREDIVSALVNSEDPRAVDPLMIMIFDRGLPDELRNSAADIIGWYVPDPDHQTLLEWWQSDDAFLQRLSLGYMGPGEADIIERVAADPHHPLYGAAISGLSFGFELPHHQLLKIQALSHSDSEIRKIAADTLLWDEPVLAADALLLAAADPVLEVVESAAYALEYYPTRQVAVGLHEIGTTHDDEQVRKEVYPVFLYLRDQYLEYLKNPDTGAHMRKWLAPIWDVLAYLPEELSVQEPSEPLVIPEKVLKSITVKEVKTLLDDPDASSFAIKDMFRDGDWQSLGNEARLELASYFVSHTDPLVRSNASKVLQIWNDQSSLIALAHDDNDLVRKSAIYNLGLTHPRSPDIAHLAWAYLQRPNIYGTPAREALRTYATHTSLQEAQERLMTIALDPDQPESLRYEAINWFDSTEDIEVLTQLMSIVEVEPLVTWSLHMSLLWTAERLSITPPDLSHLLDADNLHIQEAIAPFVD